MVDVFSILFHFFCRPLSAFSNHQGAITYALAGLSVLSAALVWGSVLVKKGGKAKAKAKSS